MLFDSHCHLQFPHYDQDRDETIKHAIGAGVFIICVGIDLKTSNKAIELAQKYKNIWAAVGLHPNEKGNFSPEIYKKLLNSEKVVGFGEIGLDYYRTGKKEDQRFQKERFKKQLQSAEKINKPIILHSRGAQSGSSGKVHKDLIDCLKSKNIRGVIHSFTGTPEEAKKYLDLGFYLGFNGIITFTNQYDEIVKYTPLENILLETDAPYLTPLPFRGKRNEPLYVKYVAEKIAELKNLSYGHVAEKTFENTKKLFNL